MWRVKAARKPPATLPSNTERKETGTVGANLTHGGQASGLRLNPQPIVSESSTGTMPALNRQNSTDSEGSQVAPNSSVSRQNSTNSLAPATPPTEPDPSKVPISKMKAKEFIDGKAWEKMREAMDKLGMSNELSKLSVARAKINNSNKIDTFEKNVINDYLRAFVLHVAFYVDSKENPQKDTELKKSIKNFVKELSEMSNRSVTEVRDNCIWVYEGSLKKIMSKITEKIVEENTKNITSGISINGYRDSFATRLLFKYLLINIIYPERARIMKEAGYDLDENKQGDPSSLFKEDVVGTINSLIGEEYLLEGVSTDLEGILDGSIASLVLITPAPGSEGPSESGTNTDGSDGGGGAPLQNGQPSPAPAVPPTSGGGGGEPVSSSQPLPSFPEVPPGDPKEDSAKDKIRPWSAPRNSVKIKEKEVWPDYSHHTVAVERTKIQPLQPRFPEKVFVDDLPDDELDGSSHDPEPAQRIPGEVGEVKEGVASAVTSKLKTPVQIGTEEQPEDVKEGYGKFVDKNTKKVQWKKVKEDNGKWKIAEQGNDIKLTYGSPNGIYARLSPADIKEGAPSNKT